MLTLLQNLSASEEENNMDNKIIQEANAAAQVNIQSETLKILQQLQAQLQSLSTEVKNDKTSKQKVYKKTADEPTFKRAITDKYCWTHGGCNHNSNNCTHHRPSAATLCVAWHLLLPEHMGCPGLCRIGGLAQPAPDRLDRESFG